MADWSGHTRTPSTSSMSRTDNARPNSTMRTSVVPAAPDALERPSALLRSHSKGSNCHHGGRLLLHTHLIELLREGARQLQHRRPLRRHQVQIVRPRPQPNIFQHNQRPSADVTPLLFDLLEDGADHQVEGPRALHADLVYTSAHVKSCRYTLSIRHCPRRSKHGLHDQASRQACKESLEFQTCGQSRWADMVERLQHICADSRALLEELQGTPTCSVHIPASKQKQHLLAPLLLEVLKGTILDQMYRPNNQHLRQGVEAASGPGIPSVNLSGYSLKPLMSTCRGLCSRRPPAHP